MANIQARKNKDGEIISYSIRVHKGRDPITGKQLKPYTMTWKVPEGWTEKRAEKEAQRQAVLFKQQARDGIILDGHQTFAEYALYVLKLREDTGAIRPSTADVYRKNLAYINPAIGHMRLDEIRPQHLNQLYDQLKQLNLRRDSKVIHLRDDVDFMQVLAEKGYNKERLIRESKTLSSDGSTSLYHSNLNKMIAGGAIKEVTMMKICKVLKMRPDELFVIDTKDESYSNNTVIKYHLLIETVLEQAVKELLIKENVAKRSAPPKREKHDPNYFQEDTMRLIWDALEDEPMNWKTMIHMFMVTGCRRGEILGLRWEDIDWRFRRIHIQQAVLYTPGKGTYIGEPKTPKAIRFVTIPQQMLDEMKEYKEWQERHALNLGDKWQGDEYGLCFPALEGNPMHPTWVNTWLNGFSERHHLPHINPHAFRHTQASLLCFGGMDMVSISHRLGHANVSTTADIYSHVIDEAENRISDTIEQAFMPKVVEFPKRKQA